MSQIPALISDLAVILISAGLVTLLFKKKLKQPVVLGYIVAGILAGPSIEQIPTVTDVESIRIWADIGVIFLLFALGLDFSFKKLMKVGRNRRHWSHNRCYRYDDSGIYHGLITGLGTYEQSFPRRYVIDVFHDDYLQGIRRHGIA